MKTNHAIRGLLLGALLAAGSASFAEVSVNIQVAPPAPMSETPPAMAPGYVWAPGYWAWHGDRHIWIHGRPIMERRGYRWQPDRWEQRNNGYYRNSGRWERNNDNRR